MNNRLKKITAGVLGAGLLLGCCGCGLQEVVPTAPPPTVHKDTPAPVEVIEGPVSPHLLKLANLKIAPKYPQMPQHPREEDYPTDSLDYYNAQQDWAHKRRQCIPDSPEDAHILHPFIETAMEQFLTGEDNSVCSPINIYFALAMLAETSTGNSRQQILDALGHSSIESLRAQANQLWRAHYCSDGQTDSLFANSVWLDKQYSFQQKTLSTLGQDHYASVFTGDLGTEEMNKQLAAWLDSQTGNLLSEYTEQIRMDPATVFALASTAYFCAGWTDDFNESDTQEQVFHAKDRDVITDFMHQSWMEKTYYWGENFSAVQLNLTGDHQMWLILPDEGSSPKDVLAQGDYYDLISAPGRWEQDQVLTVNLSMPKFDVDSQQKLIPGLRAMGITDVFNQAAADFSSFTDAPVYAEDVQHAARVVVDEEGVLAAAYTVMLACGCAPSDNQEEIDFILDRPFLFAITGMDNLPLFAGVVAEP